jgi:serine protease Do
MTFRVGSGILRELRRRRAVASILGRSAHAGRALTYTAAVRAAKESLAVRLAFQALRLAPFALLIAAASSGGARAPQATSAPDWAEILRPPQGTWPPPQERVVWREELNAALGEAREGGRPLFVTLRCLPCKQCADFDRAVLEGGPLLDPLLARFVTVRLTRADDIDLRLLPIEGFQDLDLSWWGWCLSPQGHVYAVFGGRDEVSDSTRISPQALAGTLRRVLDHHSDPRRKGWDIDGPAPELSGKPRTPRDLEGWRSWSRRDASERGADGCLHCHDVAEIVRQPAIDAGTFDKARDLTPWPFPENAGLSLDRDDGLLVEAVRPGSPAERAGLRAGDSLAAVGDRRLFGQADFRGVLHRAPGGATRVRVHYLRGKELRSADLELDEGWRATDLSWRKSVAEGNFGAHPGFPWAHPASPADRRRLAIPLGSMALRPWFGKQRDSPAQLAGLTGDDVIVAVNGESPDVSGRAFMVWFRLHHDPGSTVTLTVRDPRGRQRDLRYEVR